MEEEVNILNNKEAHLKYIQSTPFEWDVPKEKFTAEEVRIISKYGSWFHGLLNELLAPFTKEQHQFLEEMYSRDKPTMRHVEIWKKYLRLKIEKEDERGVLQSNPRLEDDPFYSRDGVKALRGQMYGIMNANHKN